MAARVQSTEEEAAPAKLRKGTCLADKYVVERVLGAGGMGMVLAAQHLILGCRVAIKVLLPAAGAIPGATERFLREARAAAALRGEHVARVLDVGMHTGMPFLVMEHLTGKDLREVLRERGPLPIEELANYLIQVCDAMAEAHTLGIVHRDLKPANIFLTARPNGTPVVKVLDFGLAKVLDGAGGSVDDASLTTTGLVIGSPPYMPPEQLRSLKLADVRSDIWSLGVIMFELLTGKRPFEAERTEGLIVAIATEQPAPPRTLRPEIPEEIEAIILRCLRKGPQERPQTVQEIAGVMAPFAPCYRSSLASLDGAGAEVVGAAATIANPLARSAAAALAVTVPGPPPLITAHMERMPAAIVVAHPDASGRDATTLTLGSSEMSARPLVPLWHKRAWTAGGVVAALLAALGLAVGLRSNATPQPAAGSETASAAAAVSEAPRAAVLATASAAVSSAPSGTSSNLPAQEPVLGSATTHSTARAIPRSTNPIASGAITAKPNAGSATKKQRPSELKDWN